MQYCSQHIGFDITNLAERPPNEKLDYETLPLNGYPLASRYVCIRQFDNYYAYGHHKHMMVCTACGLARRPRSCAFRVAVMERIEKQARAIRDIFAHALRPLPLPISREIMEHLFFCAAGWLRHSGGMERGAPLSRFASRFGGAWRECQRSKRRRGDRSLMRAKRASTQGGTLSIRGMPSIRRQFWPVV
jgi:hypothetical protein